MARAPLSIAVAQPSCAIGDLATNATRHAADVVDAGARVVVFPELSLTGYDIDAPSVDLDDPALDPLVAACRAMGSVALAGAVVEIDGARRIATLAVTGDGVSVAYAKVNLHGDELDEFVAGARPEVLIVDGWRLGLAICRDTGVPSHADATAALGIDVYTAGVVHTPDEIDEQDRRGVTTATRLGVVVAFASAAGAVGPVYGATAGTSTVWAADGTVLARAGTAPGELASTTLT